MDPGGTKFEIKGKRLADVLFNSLSWISNIGDYSYEGKFEVKFEFAALHLSCPMSGVVVRRNLSITTDESNKLIVYHHQYHSSISSFRYSIVLNKRN